MDIRNMHCGIIISSLLMIVNQLSLRDYKSLTVMSHVNSAIVVVRKFSLPLRRSEVRINSDDLFSDKLQCSIS